MLVYSANFVCTSKYQNVFFFNCCKFFYLGISAYFTIWLPIDNYSTNWLFQPALLQAERDCFKNKQTEKQLHFNLFAELQISARSVKIRGLRHETPGVKLSHNFRLSRQSSFEFTPYFPDHQL